MTRNLLGTLWNEQQSWQNELQKAYARNTCAANVEMFIIRQGIR
jgi:hypothetical protein